MYFSVTILGENGALLDEPYVKGVSSDFIPTEDSTLDGCQSRFQIVNDPNRTDYYVTESVDELVAMGNGTGTYVSYAALLTQYGSYPPFPIVQSDQLSATPSWSRVSVGIYRLTLASEFVDERTWFAPLQLADGTFATISRVGLPNYIEVNTGADGKLTKSSIEIRLYNAIL